MDEAPIDTELHAIVRDLQGIQELNFYRLSAYVEHRGYYCHENCTVIDVETIDGKTVSSDAEDSIKECLRDFMRWIYRQLEIEFEYLTSAGAVQEMIEANEYEFTEDGECY